jgi:hypothetical protein
MATAAEALGELARASYPSEDLTFDRNTRSDLQEIWQLGPNQMGGMSYGDHTKAETNVVQQNFRYPYWPRARQGCQVVPRGGGGAGGLDVPV